MKKKAMLICMMVIIMCAFVSATFAAGKPNLPNGNGGRNTLPIVKSLGRTWATVVVVVQILSVGLVVFAGLRYMFASADKKADIKRRFNLVGDRCCSRFCYINNNKICCWCRWRDNRLNKNIASVMLVMFYLYS